MVRRQGYKFEARPTGEQLRNLRRFAGACRFVYNKALALNKEQYKKKEKRLGYADLCALLPRWKTEFAWLSDVPAQALQQSLKDLERGFTNFFEKRVNFPDFHKKGRKDSFRIPQGFEVDNQNGRIKLPKMGWMRYRKSREIAGTPKNVTVSLVNGKAFISIQNEREVETPMHPSKSSVGLDWGIKGFTPCRTASMKSNCHRSNSSL
jgi:putative transposase